MSSTLSYSLPGPLQAHIHLQMRYFTSTLVDSTRLTMELPTYVHLPETWFQWLHKIQVKRHNHLDVATCGTNSCICTTRKRDIFLFSKFVQFPLWGTCLLNGDNLRMVSKVVYIAAYRKYYCRCSHVLGATFCHEVHRKWNLQKIWSLSNHGIWCSNLFQVMHLSWKSMLAFLRMLMEITYPECQRVWSTTPTLVVMLLKLSARSQREASEVHLTPVFLITRGTPDLWENLRPAWMSSTLRTSIC